MSVSAEEVLAFDLPDVSTKSEDLDLASPIVTWESPSEVTLSSRLPCRVSNLSESANSADLESPVIISTTAHSDTPVFEKVLENSPVDAITKNPTDSSYSEQRKNDDAIRNCYMKHDSETFAKKVSVDSQSSQLCKDCQNVFDHWTDVLRDERGAFRHCVSREVLEKSAEAGCCLCSQFLKAVQSEWQPSENVFPDFMKLCGLEVDLTDDETAESGFLVIKKGPDIIFDPFPAPEREVFGNDDWMISLLFFPNKTRPSIEILDVKMSPISPSKFSYDSINSFQNNTREALPHMRNWLRSCLEDPIQHMKCVTDQGQATPTRLISVNGDEIKLCETVDWKHCPKYATLSHVWGLTGFEKLTSANVNLFKKSIPAGALSKTFRDAIEVIRFLEIQYIWIDSLCIIQDQLDDWEIEASRMASVYGNSTINLAASAAKDGNFGLFNDRTKSWCCRIFLESGSRKVGYVCQPSRKWTAVSRLPLASRGWALQERYLPRRTLYFTQDEVLWGCYSTSFDETNPCRCSTSKFEHEFLRPLVGPISKLSWYNITAQYCSTQLTFSKDRLTAIAGLARQRHAFVKDEYIAGLWWRTAIHGLCWMSHGGLGKIHRITPYVAPTWSCLSINNEILLNGNFTLDEDRINPLERLHVHVQSVAITLASADRFGAITKATMRLACGHMLKCKLRDMEDTPIEIRGHNKSLMTSLTADCFSNPLIKQFIDQGLSAQVDDVQVEPFEFYIVPIKSAGPYATFAMMLLPVPGQQGVYERVGSTFPYVVATPEWREAFENENCQPMPEECVSIDVDERGRKIFVIDLV